MTASPTVMLPDSFMLEVDPTGGTTFVVVGSVKSFNLGNISADEVDVTSFSSTGNFREFRNGLKQADEGNFVVNYLIDDTQHKALRDAVGDPDPIKLRARLIAADADIEVMTFSALVRGMDKPVQIGEVLEATLTFKMTGAPTYTAVAPA